MTTKRDPIRVTSHAPAVTSGRRHLTPTASAGPTARSCNLAMLGSPHAGLGHSSPVPGPVVLGARAKQIGRPSRCCETASSAACDPSDRDRFTSCCEPTRAPTADLDRRLRVVLDLGGMRSRLRSRHPGSVGRRSAISGAGGGRRRPPTFGGRSADALVHAHAQAAWEGAVAALTAQGTHRGTHAPPAGARHSAAWSLAALRRTRLSQNGGLPELSSRRTRPSRPPCLVARPRSRARRTSLGLTAISNLARAFNGRRTQRLPSDVRARRLATTPRATSLRRGRATPRSPGGCREWVRLDRRSRAHRTS